ncbi:MAG: ATP-binding protein [Oscillospiraceae bacterium]|nr:ATP-binding protein [Oscillospiraceae bacterium]
MSGSGKILAELTAAKETAEQSSRRKSAFLAGLSHEIRAPMSVILGIAEIKLLDESLPPDIGEAFGRIYESGEMLLNLINDILDLSKIEAGKLEITPVRYDIPGLVSEAARLNALRYEKKPIIFTLLVDEKTPLELFGDKLRIMQILNNLLSNAFKYTDAGAVILSVSREAGPEDAEDVTLIFRVSDTGAGMTEEQIGRLFDEYARFSPGADGVSDGVGLGMSVVKHIAELMNSTISVESEPGKGSAFTVRVPQKRAGTAVCGVGTAEALHNLRFHGAAIRERLRFTRERRPYGSVLVVDDAESGRYVAKGMLEPYGLNLDTAASGPEAIGKIKSGRTYDIIFMDHKMPRMDGIETARILRETGYTRPIVALTANAPADCAEMFLRNGFDGFLSKPINARELNLLLNELLPRENPIPEPERRQRDSELTAHFITDAENALRVLGGTGGPPSGFSGGELEAYITAVHGMKSILANIGQAGLSAAAHALEQAAMRRDFTAMEADTPAFADGLRAAVEEARGQGPQGRI